MLYQQVGYDAVATVGIGSLGLKHRLVVSLVA